MKRLFFITAILLAATSTIAQNGSRVTSAFRAKIEEALTSVNTYTVEAATYENINRNNFPPGLMAAVNDIYYKVESVLNEPDCSGQLSTYEATEAFRTDLVQTCLLGALLNNINCMGNVPKHIRQAPYPVGCCSSFETCMWLLQGAISNCLTPPLNLSTN
jgi:hypothetical protein